jgi:hypothetical protein
MTPPESVASTVINIVSIHAHAARRVVRAAATARRKRPAASELALESRVRAGDPRYRVTLPRFETVAVADELQRRDLAVPAAEEEREIGDGGRDRRPHAGPEPAVVFGMRSAMAPRVWHRCFRSQQGGGDAGMLRQVAEIR